ncbi:Solute carrier organic anion transporter family member 1C1 [Anabarilius grahami]|uniref:Solute carrier organic anion transporter family member 1C1 n=1 Tax=Anabarilius grahami TaxID=495550 RepID=A0A3N0YV89_ANAGA|nr:Solute carrier organic anion transporter family member 1C1 [Anabarilius grahami]
MSEPTADDNGKPISQQDLCIPEKEAPKDSCCSNLKIFIVALSFAYFSKTLCGTYMKSAITQIERRFDLSSSAVGLIDGSFEMGLYKDPTMAQQKWPINSKNRYQCKKYKYDTVIQGSLNKTVSIAPCQYPMVPNEYTNAHIKPSNNTGTGCVKDPGSSMWIYVFLGNALRGIGETPVTPLGISYIDDFAKAENSAFYISCLQTIMLLGPMFGFLLGSMCAKLYVDIGFVNIDSVTITPQDARWVFHNCSCVLTPSPVEGSRSVSLGQCPRGPACTRSFTSYMAVSVLSSFINSLGTTPGYMITIRVIFLSLTTCLSGCSYFFIIAVIVLLRKQFSKEEVKALQQTARKQNEIELQAPEKLHPDGSKTDTREKTETTNAEG